MHTTRGTHRPPDVLLVQVIALRIEPGIVGGKKPERAGMPGMVQKLPGFAHTVSIYTTQRQKQVIQYTPVHQLSHLALQRYIFFLLLQVKDLVGNLY